MINPTNLNKVNEDPSQMSEASPNLAYTPEIKSSILPKLSSVKRFFGTAKGVLFLAEVLLIILVGINLKLSNDVSILDSELEDKNQDIVNVERLANKIARIQNKINIFNQVSHENPKVQSKINLVYITTPVEIELNSLALEGDVLNLNLTAQEGRDFAKFIIAYLDTKKVDRIELSGATFRVDTNSYDFSVTVYLKGNQ